MRSLETGDLLFCLSFFRDVQVRPRLRRNLVVEEERRERRVRAGRPFFFSLPLRKVRRSKPRRLFSFSLSLSLSKKRKKRRQTLFFRIRFAFLGTRPLASRLFVRVPQVRALASAPSRTEFGPGRELRERENAWTRFYDVDKKRSAVAASTVDRSRCSKTCSRRATKPCALTFISRARPSSSSNARARRLNRRIPFI